MTDAGNTIGPIDFWKAVVVDHNATAAAGIVNQLEVQDVQDVDTPSTASSFQFVEGGTGAGESNVLSPRALVAGTPTGTVSAWNSKTLVGLVLISEETVCGMKVYPGKEKDEDCMICGCSPEECPTGTHKTRRSVHGPDMVLPADGSGVYAITVRSSSQTINNKLRVFSRPSLKELDIPLGSRTSEVTMMLCSFRFRAKTLKVLIEGYPGYDFMTELVRINAGGAPRLAPLNIPSPRAGASGYGNEFAERPNEVAVPTAVQSGAEGELPRVSSMPSVSSHGSNPSLSGESSGEAGYEAAHETARASPRQGGRTFNVPQASFEVNLDMTSVTTTDPTVAKVHSSVVALSRDVRQMNTRSVRSSEHINDVLKRIESEIQELWKESDASGVAGTKALSLAQRALKLAKQSASGDPASAGGTTTPDMSAIAAHLLADDSFKAQLCSTMATGLNMSGYISESEVDLKIAAASLTSGGGTGLSSIDTSALTKRVANLEMSVDQPGGIIDLLRERVQLIEDRKTSVAVKRGGTLFKDLDDCRALMTVLGGKNCHLYSMDLVSMLIAAPDPFTTVSEGMAAEADAVKAKFDSQLDGCISVSYKLTYPPDMVEKNKSRSDDDDQDDTDNYNWGPGFASKKKFTGSNSNGAHNKYKKSLLKTYNNLQNSINASFPESTHPKAHAIFTHQNRLTYDQVTGFLESFNPIYDSMIKGGMTPKTAWLRVLVYAKSVFEDIATVRQKATGIRDPAAMVWGSFQTSELLEEYQRCDWVKHPQVTSILALAAMQYDGQSVADLKARIFELEREFKNFKNLNKSLKFK